MKKILMCLALSVALSSGIAYAQNPATAERVQKENAVLAPGKGKSCKETGCVNEDKAKPKDCKHGHVCKGKKEPKFSPFKDIQLTPEQQAKINTLKEKGKAEKAKRAEKAKKQRAKDKAAWDKQMKKILTPEQYVKYQENIAKSHKDSVGKRDRKDKKCVSHKGNKDCKHKDCKAHKGGKGHRPAEGKMHKDCPHHNNAPAGNGK